MLFGIYYAGSCCEFCTFTISEISYRLQYFTWKHCYDINILFFTQLLVDLFCAKYVDKIGYRVCIVASEVCSAAGLVGLAFLPEIIPSPFIGIIISVILYAIGSGLIEVLGSPIVEACPFENKEATMSLLHSFTVGEQLELYLFRPFSFCYLELAAGNGLLLFLH